LSAGAIFRPSRFLSVGLVGNFSIASSAREGVGEIGIRPLGSPKLTLFADAAIQKGDAIKDADWSAGAALQVLSGTYLVGRYFKSDAFTLGLAVNFGRSGVAAQSHFDADSDYDFNTYMIRLGGTKPSMFPTHFDRGQRYVPLQLKGQVDHLKYVLFDGQTLRLLDILNDIQAAIDDPRVGALALNLSAMRVRPEHAWEIREALKDAQKSGKKVIIFIDNASMTSYHLASVADKIILDPQGSIFLLGYALGRTYFKGTLEKLGLGFDEWRFFKYKSAMETLSRDSMSVADREQYQDYVDDWYSLTRTDICTSRKISPQEFDRLVDEEIYFMSADALAAGLVDTLARWPEIDGIINEMMGERKTSLPPKRLLANTLPLQNWGTPPKIAVVYGLGVCAMDEGIRARWLDQVFRGLAKSRSVKAVVFRVDSPGGDGLASDVVAEALKICSQSKPAIVSQGQVAASGGYWISMYADTIVAGPNTITGSIGVIGGWLYDKGFSEKLGMTSDRVQRGAHADLGQGVRFPFLNLQVPARNLTADERAKAENAIRKFYDIFVEKVAQGRNLKVEQIRAIAQGHFYSGARGKASGLVDELGGLLTAIGLARKHTGLKPDAEIEIIEFPRSKGWLNLGQQLSPVRMSDLDPVLQFIKMAGEQPGRALPMLLPGTYPTTD
jgi:protease-4